MLILDPLNLRWIGAESAACALVSAGALVAAGSVDAVLAAAGHDRNEPIGVDAPELAPPGAPPLIPAASPRVPPSTPNTARVAITLA